MVSNNICRHDALVPWISDPSPFLPSGSDVHHFQMQPNTAILAWSHKFLHSTFHPCSIPSKVFPASAHQPTLCLPGRNSTASPSPVNPLPTLSASMGCMSGRNPTGCTIGRPKDKESEQGAGYRLDIMGRWLLLEQWTCGVFDRTCPLPVGPQFFPVMLN